MWKERNGIDSDRHVCNVASDDPLWLPSNIQQNMQWHHVWLFCWGQGQWMGLHGLGMAWRGQAQLLGFGSLALRASPLFLGG